MVGAASPISPLNESPLSAKPKVKKLSKVPVKQFSKRTTMDLKKYYMSVSV